MKNPFDKTDRGLRHYEKLREDLEKKSDNILISLPLFIRIIFTDHSSPWYEEFNRYDLINPLLVNSKFPIFETLTNEVKACLSVCPTRIHVKDMNTQDFLSSYIIILRGKQYTVQDFISSVAYNRGLHNEPKRPDLAQLYSDFIEQFSGTAFQLALDIASCFVESFQEIHSKFRGNNDAFSPKNHRQPQIVANGKFIDDGAGRPMALYSSAYIQLPIRRHLAHGLRICLELKLVKGSEGILFQYGHRFVSRVILTCRLLSNFLLVQTESRFPGLRKTIRLPLMSEHTLSRFWLEVALYSDGSLVVAVNEWLKAAETIPLRFEIEDGKLILGSDLHGQNSASFYADSCIIEAVNKKYETSVVICYALRRLNLINGRIIPPNALQRPINIK